MGLVKGFELLQCKTASYIEFLKKTKSKDIDKDIAISMLSVILENIEDMGIEFDDRFVEENNEIRYRDNQ